VSGPLSHAPGGATPDPTRRSLLAAMTGGTAAVGALVTTGAWAACLVPRMRYEASSVRRLGAPARFPEGITFRRDEQVFVLRDDDRFRAVSAVCTHLGCTVDKTAEGFRCPCHGSAFSAEGTVLGGPAPRPLPWRPLSLAADGTLVVDLSAEVSADVALIVKGSS
jgi:menaquinol-cytochrome c reductase iron-sulfur subunit